MIEVPFRYKSQTVNLGLRQRVCSGGSSLLVSAALLVAVGCDDSGSHGELVVAIGTDMAMPQQIDTVEVLIQMNGRTEFNQMYSVGAGNQDSMIPATLTLVSGSRRDPVTIRVSGQKRGKWRTFREATTTVPTDRSALIRMPVQWLCDDSAKAVTFRDSNGVTQIRMLSSCDDGNTCVAGKCKPSLIDSTMLPDFGPKEVFGGSTNPERGQCFDTIPCMAAGSVVDPDDSCTIPKPDGDALNVNVALRVTDDGICDSTTGTICFVPLDRDRTEGWSLVEGGDRLQLPEAVCEKLKTRLVNAVYVSSECPTKVPPIPPCGPWSSVGRPRNSGSAGVPGGTAGSPAVSYPSAELVTSLIQEGTTTSVCCPLMSDTDKIYTCLCTSKTNATLVSIDVATGVSTVMGSLNPPNGRDNLRFPAEVSQDALYWAADQEIQRTPFLGSNSLADRFPVGGAVYESTTMLASAGRIFALATGFANAQGSPVQLIALEPMMPVKRFDTGGTQPVFQFAQDESALYLAVDVDSAGQNGQTRRSSSVVRLAKADGARTTVIPEQILDIEDQRGGGFTGVQVDGTSLFALFEGMPAEDGTVPVQVQRVDLTQPGMVDVAYQTTVDRNLSQLAMVGATDGAIVLSRIEYETDDDMRAVRSSSVIVVPATGPGPRIAADYAKDYPGNDLVADDDRVYWLNSSGRLYAFPRTALR